MMPKQFYFFSIMILLLSCNTNKKVPLPSQPNVLILFTDDQRFNTIHALGNEEIHTPNLDRLVEMGVSFTRAHIPGGNSGAVCAPSRAMLLTGRFHQHLPQSFTVPWSGGENQGVSPYPTFAETFRAAGYTTFFTGKWHNDPPELHDGFSEGANIYLGGMHFLKDGGHPKPWLHHFDPSGEYPAEKKWQGNKFSSELYADAAVEFIQKRTATDPFLMYVAFASPHDPRQAPARYQKLYDSKKIKLPANFLAEHPFDNGMLRVRDEELAPFPRTPERVKEEIAGYYAMVSEVDAQIGRIIDELEKTNQLENTIIVFAGDNGLAVGQHGLLGKQNVYDHSVRVPLIFAGPGIPKNSKASSLSYLLDVFPTLCHLTGVSAPETIEGKDLRPAMKQPELQLREHVFMSFIHTQRAVRTKDNWKLIRYFVKGARQEQLFNLNDDPGESKNLAKLPQHQSRLQELRQLLLSEMIAFEDPFLAPSIQVDYTNFGVPPEITIERSMPESKIYFTINGQEPTTSSRLYGAPFTLKTTAKIKARAFYQGQAISPIVEVAAPVIRNVSAITLKNEPAPQYSAKGNYSLVDGLKGSQDFQDGQWLGFHTNDLIAEIQFPKEQLINEVQVSFLENITNWIFLPTKVEIEISKDGENFFQIFQQDIPVPEQDNREIRLKSFGQSYRASLQATHLRVIAKNIGICPQWHSGKGGPAWLFVDEIAINPPGLK